jgi:heparan-alpha-glucosaminide N-acetyltransferase
VDVALFGVKHIYHDTDGQGAPVSSATCSEVYQCDVYDPEGALGWLSAAWMAWLGLQAGRVFTTYAGVRAGPGGARGTLRPFAQRWVAWGVLLCGLGGALCGFSKEDGPLPVNKNLWSPSFVVLLAGFANLILAALYAAVDVYAVWDGTPFLHAGMNSIVVYAASETFEKFFPFSATLTGDVSGHAEHLASNIAGVAAWLVFARWLYVKGFFVVL